MPNKEEEVCFLLLLGVVDVQLISDAVVEVPLSTCCCSIAVRRSRSDCSAAEVDTQTLSIRIGFILGTYVDRIAIGTVSLDDHHDCWPAGVECRSMLSF